MHDRSYPTRSIPRVVLVLVLRNLDILHVLYLTVQVGLLQVMCTHSGFEKYHNLVVWLNFKSHAVCIPKNHVEIGMSEISFLDANQNFLFSGASSPIL